MLGKITNSAKAFVNKLDTAKQRNLLSIIFVLIVLPLIIISSRQVQNLIQRASLNGVVQITLDGKEIVNGAVVTKTYIKLKATQPDNWQIASLPSQNKYSLIKQANAQVACPTKPGEPGLTTTYGTITYDSCIDNAGGTNTNNTLCSGESATRFRCYFWQNPTGCISGEADENDPNYYNYHCPAKTAAPTATTAPANPPADTTCNSLVTISGGVKNQQGQGVANAKVCLDPGTTNCDTFFGITDNEGTFVINNVRPGGSGHNVYLAPPANATVTSQNPQLSNVCRNDTKSFTVKTTGEQTPQPTATTAPNRPTATTAPRTALPTATPTPTPRPTLQTVIIENIDGGSQGSPKQQFDKGSDAGKNMLAQLLSGTFDWQLNPYATGNTRKVKIIFIDQTGKNQVSTEISVIMKASVKILNADNSIPQNNRASAPNVKLVINGSDLLANNKKSLVQTAYAQTCNPPCGDGSRCTFNGQTRRTECLPIPPTATPTPNPCSKQCNDGYHCAFAAGGARAQYCAPNAPTATPTPTFCQQFPCPSGDSCVEGRDKDNNRTRRCVPAPTTTTPTPASGGANCSPEGKSYYECSGSSTNGLRQASIGYVCKYRQGESNLTWNPVGNGTYTFPVSESLCEDYVNYTVPTTAPGQPTNPPAGRLPGRQSPPVDGGSSCPQSGDTCIYSEPSGLCFSGTGATGFNEPGCNYSCGPIACPGGGGGDDQPPLPPVGEPPTDAGGGDQPGQTRVVDAPKQPTVVIRNADSGTGGSPDREIPLTTGDITINDWMLNAPGGNSLRTVQTIFKNANGETINVVNAFVHL